MLEWVCRWLGGLGSEKISIKLRLLVSLLKSKVWTRLLQVGVMTSTSNLREARKHYRNGFTLFNVTCEVSLVV